jgi:hypothetical protein
VLGVLHIVVTDHGGHGGSFGDLPAETGSRRLRLRCRREPAEGVRWRPAGNPADAQHAASTVYCDLHHTLVARSESKSSCLDNLTRGRMVTSSRGASCGGDQRQRPRTRQRDRSPPARSRRRSTLFTSTALDAASPSTRAGFHTRRSPNGSPRSDGGTPVAGSPAPAVASLTRRPPGTPRAPR